MLVGTTIRLKTIKNDSWLNIIDFLKYLGIAKSIYDPTVVEDLSYESEAAKTLLEKVKEPLEKDVKRKYEFYAAKEDFQVKPYTASLLILPGKVCEYFIDSRENHSSIVSKVALSQIAHCLAWMESCRK